MKLVKIPVSNLDYVEFYAIELKKDNSHFVQQKKLIESQLKSSSSLFRNMFGEGEGFKQKAREYLKKVGMIK